MDWTSEADDAVRKVPFFVRKKVRARVEAEVEAAGKGRVTLAEVRATQARYLKKMGSEIKGYQVDACFGPGGCPNRVADTGRLLERIETLLKAEDLLKLLKERVAGEPKFHHEFRITLAECPNACSQPQIKDMGIVGAVAPRLTDEPCSRCGACLETCREGAISFAGEDAPTPDIDLGLCVECGQCIDACPTGTLDAGDRGYRVFLGGKLGRHPRLARELPGRYGEDEVIDILKACIDFYREHSPRGERFAETLSEADFERLAERFGGRKDTP